MAAKTYRRFPLRVIRPRDPVLGGTSDYYPLADPTDIMDGWPLQAAGGGLLRAIAQGNAIVAFALQDALDKNGDPLSVGDEIETFLANDPGQIFLEGNLLDDQGADYVLAAADLFREVTLTYDANYFGAGEPGFYFDQANPGGGVGAVEGRGVIVSFTNTRVPPDNEESYSIPGDTNAVVRVQLYHDEYLLGAESPPVGP